MADDIVFTARGLDALQRALDASPRDVERAERRALRRTVTWVRKQMLRQAATEFRVPQARLKDARRAASVAGRSGARAWLGMDPLRSGYVGRPRQQRKGARVGKHSFPGAFVARLDSGYTGIFKRRGKSRLPLDEMVVKPEHGITDSFLAWLQAEADQRLLQEFTSNLEFYSGARG